MTTATIARLDYTPQPCPVLRKARKYTAQERQCWRTPNTPQQPVLWLVAQALGGEIGLDPTADSARSVPAHKHITAAEDCLVWPWRLPYGVPKTGFMNPQFDKPHRYLPALIDNTCRSDTLQEGDRPPEDRHREQPKDRGHDCGQCRGRVLLGGWQAQGQRADRVH
jgi:hypothetical protein